MVRKLPLIWLFCALQPQEDKGEAEQEGFWRLGAEGGEDVIPIGGVSSVELSVFVGQADVVPFGGVSSVDFAVLVGQDDVIPVGGVALI